MRRGGRSQVSRPRLVRAFAAPAVTGSLAATLPPVAGSESGTYTAPSTGLAGRPNQPAGYSTVHTANFSGTPQTDPPTNGQVAVAMAGEAAGWYWSYFGTAWSQVSDASAPQSPNGTWKGTFPATTGTINTGGGRGIGQFFYFVPNINRIYVCVHMKVSSNYIWHPISNKWLNLEGNNGAQTLVQLYGGGSKWMQFEELSTDAVELGTFGTAISAGQWHRFEVQIDIPSGLVKVWQDGTLTVSGTHSFISSTFNTFGIYPFRGGGQEDGSVPDMDWHMDEITIAY